MTKYPELWAALAAPFANVKTRQQAGRTFSYLTARQVMNRLDETVGPESWHDDYIPNGDNSVICRLTITLPDGQSITKCDAGGNAGMSDQGDDDKSMFSDAFKRAAVKFLVGRSLYQDGLPSFAQAAAKPTPAPVKPAAKAPAKPAAKYMTGPELLAAINSKHIDGLEDWLVAKFEAQGFPDRVERYSLQQVQLVLPALKERCAKAKLTRELTSSPSTNGKPVLVAPNGDAWDGPEYDGPSQY